ncbi:MAG: phosphatase PAP2 family protein [Acutalibacteraceae bacterium]
MFEKIQYYDDRVINWIAKIQSPRRNKLMIFFTRLGDKGLIWFTLCAPFFIFPQTRLVGTNILVALVMAHLAGEVLIKHLVCRIRPCHKLDEDENIIKKPKYYSFPSGHTTSSFSVVAVTLFRFWPVAIPVTIIAFLIAFSRLYLRVHYLTDVLAGMMLGLLCGFLSVELFNTIF